MGLRIEPSMNTLISHSAYKMTVKYQSKAVYDRQSHE
jgi:hypothetical protein